MTMRTPLLLCFLLLPDLASFAQSPAWKILEGPSGLLEQAPSVSANGTVFINGRRISDVDVSTDQGLSWHNYPMPLTQDFPTFKWIQQTNGNTFAYFQQRLLQFDHATPGWQHLAAFDSCKQVVSDSQNRLWKQTPDGNLWVSADLGNTFQFVPQNIGDIGAQYALHNDAHNLAIMWAGSDLQLVHFDISGQQTLINLGINNLSLYWVKYNPYTGVAYLKTNQVLHPLKKSLDGGLTWQDQPMPDNFSENLTDLFFSNTGEIWAFNGSSATVSSDQGATWTLFPAPEPDVYTAAYALSANAQQIVVYQSICETQALYISTDKGATWTDRSALFKYPDVRHITKTTGGALFAESCMRRRVEVTHDEGAHWQPLVIPAGVAPFVPTSICQSSNGYLFAPADQKIYRSTDGGSTWESMPFTAFNLNSYHRIIAGNDGTLYIPNGQGKGAFSTDFGNSWSEMGYAPLFYTANSFGDCFDPNGHFYRGTFYYLVRYVAQFDFYDFFYQPASGFIEAFTVTPSGRILVVVTDINLFSQKMYYSDDDGVNFQEMPPLPEWAYSIRLYKGADRLLMALNGKYYQSLDDGNTWVFYFDSSVFQAAVNALYFSPDNYLYAALNTAPIQRTEQALVAAPVPASEDRVLSLYPNPTGDWLYLNAGLSTESAILAEVYDASGRCVAPRQALDLANGRAALRVQPLPAGIYLLMIRHLPSGAVNKGFFYKK